MIWAPFCFATTDICKSYVRILGYKIRQQPRGTICLTQHTLPGACQRRLPHRKHICGRLSTVPGRFHEPNRRNKHVPAHICSCKSHVPPSKEEQAFDCAKGMALDERRRVWMLCCFGFRGRYKAHHVRFSDLPFLCRFMILSPSRGYLCIFIYMLNVLKFRTIATKLQSFYTKKSIRELKYSFNCMEPQYF